MNQRLRQVAAFSMLVPFTLAPVTGQTPQAGPVIPYEDREPAFVSPLNSPASQPIATPVPTDSPMFSSFWWIDADTDALVELTNNTKVTRNVSLHLIEDQDTTETQTLDLEPQSTTRISVKALLGDENTTRSRWGSAALGGETNGVTAWIVSEDTRRSLSIESLFQRSDLAASSVVGQWWLPTDDARAFFVIQNISFRSQEASVDLYFDGSRIPGSQITLPAQSSLRLDLHDLVDGPVPAVGAVQIRLDSGDPVLFGRTVLLIEEQGFSLSTLMERPEVNLGTELYTPPGPSGVLGPQWGFPEGADFINYAVVTNLSEQSVRITMTEFSTSQTFGSWAGAPSTLVLKPLETRLLGGGPSPSEGRFISARLRHSGRPGDVVAVGIAVDQSLSYSFHCPFLDHELVGSHKLAVSFDLSKGRTSLLLVKNTSNEPLPYQYLLQYRRDGKPQVFTSPRAKLHPQEIHAINLKELLGRPDGIPADVLYGSAIVYADRKALIASDPTIDRLHHSIKLCQEYCWDAFPILGLPSCASLWPPGEDGNISFHGPAEVSLILNVAKADGTFDCKFHICGSGPCRNTNFWATNQPYCPAGLYSPGLTSVKFWILRLCTLWDLEELTFHPC